MQDPGFNPSDGEKKKKSIDFSDEHGMYFPREVTPFSHKLSKL